MKHARARWAMGIAVATTMLAATPAFASGGSAGGGGGGGGGGATTTIDSKNAPCVQVNSLSTSADQSVVTDGAFVSEAATLSRCGGNNASFTVVLSAVDGAGNQLFSQSSSWFPERSLPYSTSQSSESAAFGTTYAVTVQVIVPETGAVAASSTRSVSTPASRVATCANVTNVGGTAGYYPGLTTAGALWLSDSIRNCGGREWLDTSLTVVNDATGAVVASYPNSAVVAANGSTGYGLLDVEPVPTGTPYHVEVEVHRHSTGELLDHSTSLALVTPPAR